MLLLHFPKRSLRLSPHPFVDFPFCAEIGRSGSLKPPENHVGAVGRLTFAYQDPYPLFHQGCGEARGCPMILLLVPEGWLRLLMIYRFDPDAPHGMFDKVYG